MNGPSTTAALLAASPDIFPQAFDPVVDAVRLIWFSRRQFAEAAFLDDRVVTPQLRHESVHFAHLDAAVATTALSETCGYIFHLGHVGSTLVSRLLGAQAGVFSLREPGALRTLAQLHAELATAESLLSAGEFERRLSLLLRLWSRTYGPGQLAVIKATSPVSEMAASLLSRPSRPRALFMTVTAEVYLATLMSGQNAHIDVRNFAPMRLRRLHRRLGRDVWRLPDLSPGEMAAMGWACEMTALTAADEAAPGGGQWLDFDRFLAWPEPPLLAAFAHFGREVGEDEARAILAGPDMGRYSKATEHAFDAAARRVKLQDARQRHGEEIGKGVAWLERAAAEVAEIAVAIAKAGENAAPRG